MGREAVPKGSGVAVIEADDNTMVEGKGKTCEQGSRDSCGRALGDQGR